MRMFRLNIDNNDKILPGLNISLKMKIIRFFRTLGYNQIT